MYRMLSLNVTQLAREAQKKALAEANVVIEKNKADKAAAKASSKDEKKLPTIPEEPEPAQQGQQQPAFTTGQWIGIAAIVVTVVTTYVKREDLKALYERAMSKPPPRPQQQQPPQRNNLPTMD